MNGKWRKLKGKRGDYLGIILGLFGEYLGLFWEYLGNIWGYFGNILGLFWEYLGNTWVLFWEYFGNISGLFGDYLGTIWGMFWEWVSRCALGVRGSGLAPRNSLWGISGGFFPPGMAENGLGKIFFFFPHVNFFDLKWRFGNWSWNRELGWKMRKMGFGSSEIPRRGGEQLRCAQKNPRKIWEPRRSISALLTS